MRKRAIGHVGEVTRGEGKGLGLGKKQSQPPRIESIFRYRTVRLTRDASWPSFCGRYATSVSGYAYVGVRVRVCESAVLPCLERMLAKPRPFPFLCRCADLLVVFVTCGVHGVAHGGAGRRHRVTRRVRVHRRPVIWSGECIDPKRCKFSVESPVRRVPLAVLRAYGGAGGECGRVQEVDQEETARTIGRSLKWSSGAQRGSPVWLCARARPRVQLASCQLPAHRTSAF